MGRRSSAANFQITRLNRGLSQQLCNKLDTIIVIPQYIVIRQNVLIIHLFNTYYNTILSSPLWKHPVYIQ